MYKKIILGFCLCTCFSSCLITNPISNKIEKETIFESKSNNSSIDCDYLFIFSVPKNHKNNRYYILEHNGYYWAYKDKNCVPVIYYNSNYYESLNQERIKRSFNDSIWQERFNMNYVYTKCLIKSNHDTLQNSYYPIFMDLSGMDSNGTHWRDIRYEWFSYGYQNIPEKDVTLFDSILSMIKITKLNCSQ